MGQSGQFYCKVCDESFPDVAEELHLASHREYDTVPGVSRPVLLMVLASMVVVVGIVVILVLNLL